MGPVLRFCGYIPGGNKTPAAGVLVLRESIRHLRAGRSVLIFPEGTRSPAFELGPFKWGAFKAACSVGAPIVPVTVSVTPPLMTKAGAFHQIPERRVTFSIEVQEPVHSSGWEDQPRVLGKQIREFMLCTLAQRPEYSHLSASPAPCAATHPILQENTEVLS